MTSRLAKRLWTNAAVVSSGNGYAIHLDAKPLNTPAKNALILPTQSLAEAIAGEWRAQGERINPATMPLTRTANSAIDKVRTQLAEVATLIAAYGDSDLLCYRAPSPQELIARQAAAWNPVLAWAAQTFGAELTIQTGVVHVPQNAVALDRLSAEVHAMNHFELAAFHDQVSLSGSLILGLACIRGFSPPETLWQTSRIDEEWQQELWGVDEEASELAETRRQAFLDAAQFFSMVLI